MEIKKIAVQALVAVFIFTVFSVILSGDYSQEMWFEKGLRGLVFGMVYFVFLILRNKFKKSKEQE